MSVLLNELHYDLALNKAKIKYQIKEISWTESMIIELQNIVNKHQENLNNYITEKTFLTEQNSHLRLLKYGDCADDTSVSEIEEINIPTYVDSNYILNGLTLFSDGYDIISVAKSPSFYQSISTRLFEQPNIREIHYNNHTVIPNDLKVSTVARKMILYRIESPGEYNLNDILGQTVNMSVDMHIANGCGELLSVRGEGSHLQYHNTAIHSPKSYFILKTQTMSTRFVLLVTEVPMLIAFDVLNPVEDTVMVLPTPIGFDMSVIATSNLYPRRSFVRRNFQLKDIRNRLLFMDVSFAEDINGFSVPLSVTLLDYCGVVVMDTVMCPRNHIRHYNEQEHGLGEVDVIGKQDSEEVMAMFYKVIWDGIIVGNGLWEMFQSLRVNVDHLCGVRELQGSYAMMKRMPIVTEERKTWTLCEMVERILKRQLPEAIMSTTVIAEFIRKIYVAIESDWENIISEYNMNTLLPYQGSRNKNPRK